MPKINDPTQAKKFFEAKMSFTTGPVEVDHHRKEEADDFTLIDVRAAADYEKEHIPGAINLPQDEWESLRGLEKNKNNIIYCYSIVCHLAAKAALKFANHGFPVMEMDGGFKSWKEHHLETEQGRPVEERSETAIH